MAGLDLKAERDKIQREIEALEKSLGPNAAEINLDVSDSDDNSDDDLEEQLVGDCQADDVIWEDGGTSAEMCLQMNLVYQAVIQEKLQELEVLISQNKEQQEELMWELAGRKTQRAGTSKPYPLNLAIGHFLKPYFKDKVTGVGPPANEEMKERSVHIVKTFQELTSKKWKSSDTLELRKAIFSDTLQRLLQPKMLKVEYLQQKQQNTKDDIERKIFTKQVHEAEREIDEINQLQEDALLGHRTDPHDWDKISNIHFEGVHSAERLCRIWQNNEHPHVNKEVWSAGEIEKLKKIAMDHNFVDWQAIAQELGTNRTAFQCLQMFQSCNKGFKRSEFTKEEDEMLTQFVQQMRVGEHIPYNKISYFMEGRDGLQLLYRWTKSLDPSLRKGPWSKEEDEMLLKAVAKHGEKDWYKIRLEVPGRSDVQCRERYLKGLHKDVKKGKWSLEEKEKLFELTSKYGVGHWAQVSRELPHRTASQCLSKWKHVTGYFKRKRMRLNEIKQKRPPKHRKPKKPASEKKTKIKKETEDEISSASSSSESSYICSSSSSSSESDDEAMELDDYGGADISDLLKSIPDLDLWIPRKKSLGLQDKSLHVYSSSSSSHRTKKRKSKEVSFQFNTILKGIAYPPSTDTITETAEKFVKEAERKGHEILQIREADILKILTKNTRQNERNQMQRLQRQSKPVPDSGTDQQEDSRTSLSQMAVTRLYRASVDRKLLCAVTRWIGNVYLPLSTSSEKRHKGRTQADVLNKKLSCVTITSTPIFTLLIQFFQIDAEGCLQMIQLQKNEAAEFCRKLKSTAKSTTKTTQKTENLDMSQKNILETASPRPQKRRQSTPKTPRIRSSVPAPKLKTVSELLHEKRRMQKLNAAKSVQRTALLCGNILVPPQILIQQHATPTVQSQPLVLPVAQTTSQNGSWPGRPFSPKSAKQAVTTNNASSNLLLPVSGVPISRQRANTTGSEPVPQKSGVQTNVQSGSSGVSPASQLLSPQVTLLPKTVFSLTSPSGSPLTFLVTPQGLIPISCPNLTQQSGIQGPKTVSIPSNTVTTGTVVTGSLSGSMPNKPSDTSIISAQPKTQQSMVMSSPIAICPQESDTNLPMLAQSEISRKPSQILSGNLSQAGAAVTSSVESLPQVVGSSLQTVVPTEVSKMLSLALPTITNSVRHEDTVTTTSAVSNLLAGPCLPMPSPSDASEMSSQVLPTVTSSIGQEKTETTAINKSQSQMAGCVLTTLTPSSASKVTCSILPVTSALKQVDTVGFSASESLQKEASSYLPIPTPSRASIMISPTLPVVTSPLEQEGTLVASSVTSQLQMDSTCLPAVSPAPKVSVSIPTQASSCSDLTQQSGNQSPKIVIMPSNTAATGIFVTELSSGSMSNKPSNTLSITAQPLPATPSSKTQQSTITSSAVVKSLQVPDPNLPMLAQSETSGKPLQISPSVKSCPSQSNTAVTSLVCNLPQVQGSPLPTIVPKEVSKIPSLALSTMTSSIMRENLASTSSGVGSPLVVGLCLPLPAPSDATEMLGNTLPVVTTALKQLDTAAFTPPASSQKEATSLLTIPAPSSTSMMIYPTVSVATSSLGQKSDLITSSVTSHLQLNNTCLPKADITQGLPDKASQLKLTPQKYPIVKIAKLLQTNDPNEFMAKVTTSDPQSSLVPNNSSQTANSEKKNLDVKLISLEEEKHVKEWLQGKKCVEVPKQNSIPYFPPSACTLKTFSRLLLEKKLLEENAFKLLPLSDATEVSSMQKRTTLSNMVEEKLKDNAAYQLIKQRFLSAFTIPGFMAVLPPTFDSIKHDSDEEFEDLMDCETNMEQATQKENGTATESGSLVNTSEGTKPMLTEQDRPSDCSAENANIENTEKMLTRRSIYCRPVT